MEIDSTLLREMIRNASQAGGAPGATLPPAEPSPDDMKNFADAMSGAVPRPEKALIGKAVQAEKAVTSMNGVDVTDMDPQNMLRVLQKSNEIHFLMEFWAKLAGGLTQGINKLASMS